MTSHDIMHGTSLVFILPENSLTTSHPPNHTAWGWAPAPAGVTTSYINPHVLNSSK